MKLSLIVRTEGPGLGKKIPVTLSQFLIGRDEQCHLRPKSAVISKRHCALLVRGGKVFIRDFGSTNGTFVNDEPVKGERELRNNDALKIGPLLFGVLIEATAAVNKPTPVPATPSAASDDDSVAAMLLSIGDDGTPAPAGRDDGVPAGSTVMDFMPPPDTNENKPVEAKPDPKKAPAKPASGNTSSAAKAILEKYTRRQRS
jgi:predicted component of type VI protein secretion system